MLSDIYILCRGKFMAYLEEDINNIRASADIVSIIGSYINLEKKGSDYVGMCPFHDDHSPSMHVSTKLNIFKCFVCNTGGNVFSFVQKYENVPYLEAVKIVAEKSGIDFKYNNKYAVKSKFQSEYQLMDLSLKFYQNNLASASGLEAKKYLLNRGIDDKIIKEFKIGLSFEDNKLKEFLENKKCDLESAYSLGLLNKSGITYYDMFQSRIMIPIFDAQGNTVGYTARCYLKDEPNKYINSKETKIYHKSDILFNLNNAKEYIRAQKEVIVVEGNMDAISLACAGIKNVVALMGVIVSPSGIELLKKLNSKIILMLDSDNAGSIATLKVGDSLIKSGLDVCVVRLKGAKDPDEYIRKNGAEALENNIKHATKYLDFKINELKNDFNLDNPIELAKYVSVVLDSLKDLNTIEKEVTISKICKDYGLDPKIIKSQLKGSPPKEKAPAEKVIPVKKKSKYDLAASQAIYAMLMHKDYYQIFMNNLGFFENKVEREALSLIGSYIKKNNTIDASGFIDYIIKYDSISAYIMEVLSSKNNIDIDEAGFYNLIKVLTKSINEIEIKEIKNEIKNENDINKKEELIKRLTELKKEVE